MSIRTNRNGPARRSSRRTEALLSDSRVLLARGIALGGLPAKVHRLGTSFCGDSALNPAAGSPRLVRRPGGRSGRSTCRCSSRPATFSSCTTTHYFTTGPPLRIGPSQDASAICCVSGWPPREARPCPKCLPNAMVRSLRATAEGLLCKEPSWSRRSHARAASPVFVPDAEV